MARIVFVSPYDQYALGVRYLSSVLKKTGHRTRIIALKKVFDNRHPQSLRVDSGYEGDTACCSSREYELVRELIKDFQADFIGISLASQCFGVSAWLSSGFHRDFPGIPVIWGGADPTLHPEIGIEHCDFLAVGEAEDSLPELLQLIGSGRDPAHVAGFWVRRGETVFRNPVRPLIQDLDRIPFPDFDRTEKFLVQHDQVRPLNEAWYLIMTQRGCPYRCGYCAHGTLPELYPGQRYVRRRSVANVIEELRWIRGLYPELGYLAFYDDIFTLNKKWLREFAPRYRDEIALPFWCYTYPGHCDDESASLLKQMGIDHVQVGIQSGSDRTLREIYNRPDPAQVGATARILDNYGIRLRYDLIAGNPLETEEDHLATLEVLLDLPHPFRINPANPLCFYFNSPITRLAKERGVPLRQLKGVNGCHPAEETHYRFWRNLYDLTQYPVLDKDFIRLLAKDPSLKRHPEILESFNSALEQSFWSEPQGFESSREALVTRQAQIRSLAAERDELRNRLRAIEGKWLYRLYKGIRKWLPDRR